MRWRSKLMTVCAARVSLASILWEPVIGLRPDEANGRSHRLGHGCLNNHVRFCFESAL